MKQLLSLTCMGLFCLLLSSVEANAQISRKGDPDAPKVILKKDKPGSTETDSRNSEPQTKSSPSRTSGQSPTQTDSRTYPDRKDGGTTTSRTSRQFPETTNRYPRSGDGRSSDGDYRNQGRRDQDGQNGDWRRHDDHDSQYRKNGKNCQECHCDHPGKGKHLGWHKQKNKKGRGH